jgi:hypothetical protein
MDTTTDRDSRAPLDLQPPQADPWPHLQVPPGWQAVADLALEVRRHLDPLTRRIVGCVRDEIPVYRTGPVPAEDLAASIHHTIDTILLGLAERRPPAPDEVVVRRELGARRALQGVPLDALLAAYQVGYRELWLALVRALPPGDAALATSLLEGATLMWRWMHELTDAIGAAHAGTVRTIEARDVSARQRLVELLVAGDLGGEAAVRLARSLGFETDGAFGVTVVRGARDDLDAVALQRRVDVVGGHHAVAARGPWLVVVSQGPDDLREVASIAGGIVPLATVASGAIRTGLGGARDSLRDAELALAVLPDGSSATFEEVWLWASLHGEAPRLAPLLAPGAATARAHPHLAAAVQAYADAGFSVSAAARELSLHPNTVGYRLDRWSELTGWDPRTFAGLVRSLASLHAAGTL